jgi:hypothetical protein
MMRVAFEDLVSTPGEVMRNVWGWLGISLESLDWTANLPPYMPGRVTSATTDQVHPEIERLPRSSVDDRVARPCPSRG